MKYLLLLVLLASCAAPSYIETMVINGIYQEHGKTIVVVAGVTVKGDTVYSSFVADSGSVYTVGTPVVIKQK